MCAGLLAVKIFLSAATCQDVQSLGRGSRAVFVELCVCVLVTLLSRCSTLWQLQCTCQEYSDGCMFATLAGAYV